MSALHWLVFLAIAALIVVPVGLFCWRLVTKKS